MSRAVSPGIEVGQPKVGTGKNVSASTSQGGNPRVGSVRSLFTGGPAGIAAVPRMLRKPLPAIKFWSFVMGQSNRAAREQFPVSANTLTGSSLCGLSFVADLWRFERRDLNRYDSLFAGPYHLGSRRRQIDDSAPDVGAAVLDDDDGTLAVAQVGDSRPCSERQRLARRIIRVRVHPRAIGHLVSRQPVAVDRRLARARLARGVGRMFDDSPCFVTVVDRMFLMGLCSLRRGGL